jgi:hypothetical protein
MKSKRIHFFATPSDIRVLLQCIESNGPLKYLVMQNSESANITKYECSKNIPRLGFARRGSSAACEQFLILKESEVFNERKISGESGGTRYLVDQLLNVNSVAFNAGGLWTDKVLLQGWVASAYDGPIARELLDLFSAGVRKSFQKVGAVWIGPEAKNFWEAGGRLTVNALAGPEFDFARR